MPDLESLKATRRDVSGRLAAVMDARTKLQDASRAEEAALAAIGKLGEAEVEAVRAWATAGGEGDMPQPDVAERKRLADRLVECQAKAAAARGAIGTFDADHATLAGQLRQTSAEIDDIAFDTIEREHAEAVEDLGKWIVDEARPRIARILGLRAAITEMANQHRNSGRGEDAMALFRRGERVGAKVVDLDFEPASADIVRSASDWRARFYEISGDVPAKVVQIDPERRRLDLEANLRAAPNGDVSERVA